MHRGQLMIAGIVSRPRTVEVRERRHESMSHFGEAVEPGRLGKSVGFLSLDEMRRADAALHIVLDL